MTGYDLCCLLNAYKISVELLKNEIDINNLGQLIIDLNDFIYDMEETNFERLIKLLNQTFC
ncbi:MAG: hypothetical protein J6K87_00725 [Clostridia bacterium]|nr:hypothetical protein [Clostridia bacterium]